MDKIINTLGRRKTAVARIYMQPGSGNIVVNGKDYKNYFSTMMLQKSVNEPFVITDKVNQFDIKVNLDGGGITGQAEALRLAISRALVEIDEENRPLLKPHGFLTRDPRMVERKKFGQKKARKKFQFSKR